MPLAESRSGFRIEGACDSQFVRVSEEEFMPGGRGDREENGWSGAFVAKAMHHSWSRVCRVAGMEPLPAVFEKEAERTFYHVEVL